MLKAFLKRNGILMLALAAWIAGVLGIASIIDDQFYWQKKRDMINEVWTPNLFPEAEELKRLAGRWRNEANRGTAGIKEAEKAIAEFREAAKRVVEGESSIFHVALFNGEGAVLVDAAVEGKYAKFNNARNSLWSRKFDMKRSAQLLRADGKPGGGIFAFYHTTPWPGTEELRANLESLTLEYWIWTAVTILAYSGLCAAIALWILLPMRNVTSGIEESTPERTRFIRRPRSNLERLYNAMARDTVLARLQERLLERIGAGEAFAPWQVVEEAARGLQSQGTVDAIACMELEKEEGQGPRAGGGRLIERDARALPGLDEEALFKALEASARAATAGEATLLDGAFAAQSIADPERPAVSYAVAISLGTGEGRLRGPAAQALALRVAAILRAGLEALAARNRTLSRERDRASINLARSLGHDLTNIIATGKLELMTLGQIVRAVDKPIEGERREILNQSLDALLNSIKFLQEVVNLYRSYAFLKEPTFERLDPNPLISETVELFQLSTSKKALFTERLDPASPKLRVDPRLFKLALFNLFSNALDAIRRAGNGQGKIEVSTAIGAGGGLVVAVHDNGTGIRNEAGEPASPQEIERIFTLGFTLGREGEGEGLGLNWVRTIVEQIHGGTIRAHNPPEGGARFDLVFPLAGEG